MSASSTGMRPQRVIASPAERFRRYTVRGNTTFHKSPSEGKQPAGVGMTGDFYRRTEPIEATTCAFWHGYCACEKTTLRALVISKS
jgi:hypothetical protein